MSTIQERIYHNDWPSDTIISALFILGEKLEISWLEQIEDVLQSSEITRETELFSCLLDTILESGQELLRVIGSQSNPDELVQSLSHLEEIDFGFARHMSFLRRRAARVLAERGDTPSGFACFVVWLDYTVEILTLRDASPFEPIKPIPEKVYISKREREAVLHLLDFFQEHGIKDISLGEREEATLCLCQHFYSLGELQGVADLLVEVIETGIQDPLIYHAYYMFGVALEDYEAAFDGLHAAITANPALSPLPLDRYRIEEILHHDSQKTVFRVYERFLEEWVCVQCFFQPPLEVKKVIGASTRLEHEVLVKAFNFHEHLSDYPCLVTEYFQGTRLDHYIYNNGPFPLAQGLELALQVVGCMAYAHDLNWAHGRICPHNLLWDEGKIKLRNFGLFPFWKKGQELQDPTEFYYISPELIENAPAVASIKADVYSLAMTIYFMITARHPHPMVPRGIPNKLWLILTKAIDQSTTGEVDNANQLLEALAFISKDSQPLVIEEEKTHPTLPAHPTAFREEEAQETVTEKEGELVMLPKQFSHSHGEIRCDRDGSEMCLVRAGTFLMGSYDRESETPEHEVFLGNYLIDKYPVTNKQYSLFLEYLEKSGDKSFSHPQDPQPWSNRYPKHWRTPEYERYSPTLDHPVIFVSWWDAWSYAKWAGKFLPTEAQWEKAARGTRGNKFPWGNQEAEAGLANYGNNVGECTAIGSYPLGVSPYGCHDMAGNVWEWCLDTYEKNYYQNSKRENPVNFANKPSRVLRGGSWRDAPASIRSSCRGCWVNIVRYSYIGFRCVYNLD